METTSPPATAAPSPARRSITQRLLEWTLILTVTASVGGCMGDLWWIFDLCNHFRFQYIIVLLPVVVYLGVRKWCLSASMMFALLALAINAVLLWPTFFGPVHAPANVSAAHASSLTVMGFNVHTRNRRFDEVAQFINQSDAQIVVVQEIDSDWDFALRTKATKFRTMLSMPRDDNFGMSVLGRLETTTTGGPLVIEQINAIDVAQGIAQVPTMEVIGTWHGQKFALLGLHTLPPVRASTAHVRDHQIHGAGLWTQKQQQQSRAAIILGDLNATPWCAPFKRLREDTGLLSSQEGRGLQGSWPARVPALFRIPIDHCLHSRDLQTIERAVGPAGLGSDHLPLTVTLGWLRNTGNEKSSMTKDRHDSGQ